jgi:virulence factor Mce-like protein
MLSRWGRRARAALAVLCAVGVLGLPACSGGGGGYEVTAYFDKAVSLYKQGDVKILGLSSGKVTEVKVVGTQVRVRMRIDEDASLPRDVQATIVPLSLIGERYVQLYPAWTNGEPKAPPGTVIPIERTTVPVEPDEALAALKKFLDTLDPNATGRLVKNLADDLRGNGQTLNDALGNLGRLSTTLADKDQELGHLIDNFDKFTATLRTRESQLGRVMDEFATTTSLLAQERETIARLLKGLAQVSTAGLDLVAEHAGPLNTDIQTLTHTLETVLANFEYVKRFLTATPQLVAGVNLDGQQGLVSAFDPAFHHIDLRQSTTPTLTLLLDALGLPSLPVCLPIDVNCDAPATAAAPAAATAPGTDRQNALAEPAPVDAIVGFLGSPASSTRSAEVSGLGAAPSVKRSHRHGLWGWARAIAEVFA